MRGLHLFLLSAPDTVANITWIINSEGSVQLSRFSEHEYYKSLLGEKRSVAINPTSWLHFLRFKFRDLLHGS